MSWLMWIAAIESAQNIAYFNVLSSVSGEENLYSVRLIDALMLMQLQGKFAAVGANVKDRDTNCL